MLPFCRVNFPLDPWCHAVRIIYQEDTDIAVFQGENIMISCGHRRGTGAFKQIHYRQLCVFYPFAALPPPLRALLSPDRQVKSKLSVHLNCFPSQHNLLISLHL